jgi:hypothetical protein
VSAVVKKPNLIGLCCPSSSSFSFALRNMSYLIMSKNSVLSVFSVVLFF